jgi:hypothetical protein
MLNYLKNENINELDTYIDLYDINYTKQIIILIQYIYIYYKS